MAITPTGSPPWSRTSDFSTYGGHVSKSNYQSEGSVNGRTDVSAEEFSRLVDDLARVAAVAEFATLRVACSDAVPAAPTLSDYDAMAGAAPAGVRNGDGDVTLTWSASYADAYGVSADLHIVHVTTGLEGAVGGTVMYELSDPDGNGKNERVRLRAINHANAAIADAVFTLAVATS